VSTSGALALRGGGSNRTNSGQGAGRQIWPCKEGGSATGRLTARDAFQGFLLIVLACLVLVVLYLIFGLTLDWPIYGQARNLRACQIGAPRFVKVGIVTVPEPLSIVQMYGGESS
jgi:hypothetical protein